MQNDVQLELKVVDTVVHGDHDKQLLKVENLTIQPGELVGVRGPSGAGKTTLMYLLTGLMPPARGNVFWGDINLYLLEESARDTLRRDHIGMVFQEFLLFEELSPADNVAIAQGFVPKHERAALKDRAERLLGQLGVVKDVRSAETYSGGERQRIAVARALARSPEILVADELTANLDRETAQTLIDDLSSTVRAMETTFIAISHDEALLSAMDRIIEINQGNITADAPVSEFDLWSPAAQYALDEELAYAEVGQQ